MSRALFEALGPLTEPMREIRFLPDEALLELTDDERAIAARSLRGLAYSANEGARRIERFEYRRREGLLDQDDDEHQEEATSP